MERPISYKPAVLTTAEPISLRNGTLSDEKRSDKKLVIIDDVSGFFEVHGDGTVGWQKDDVNHAMAGASFAGLNFLEYPGHSDRGGVARPTFLVAFYDRD